MATANRIEGIAGGSRGPGGYSYRGSELSSAERRALVKQNKAAESLKNKDLDKMDKNKAAYAKQKEARAKQLEGSYKVGKRVGATKGVVAGVAAGAVAQKAVDKAKTKATPKPTVKAASPKAKAIAPKTKDSAVLKGEAAAKALAKRTSPQGVKNYEKGASKALDKKYPGLYKKSK